MMPRWCLSSLQCSSVPRYGSSSPSPLTSGWKRICRNIFVLFFFFVQDEQSAVHQVHLPLYQPHVPSAPADHNRWFARTNSKFVFKLQFLISACIPIDTIQGRENLTPQWYEWTMLSESFMFSMFSYKLKLKLKFIWFLNPSVWFSGLLLTELTTVGERTGLGILK